MTVVDLSKQQELDADPKAIQQNNFAANLILPHPLTNFEMQKCFQNEPRFNGVYSRYNIPKTKDRVHVINLDEYSDIGTHWIALYIQNNDVRYFDSFRAEHIPKEIRTFIGNKNMKTNIFRIQAYDLKMCG